MQHIQSPSNPTMPYCGQAGLPPEEPLLPHDALKADPAEVCPRCLAIRWDQQRHAARAQHRMELEAEARRRALGMMAGEDPA